VPGSETTRRRRARLLIATLAWVVGVFAATAVGMMAVGAIGDGIIGTGQRPLTAQEVEARLVAPAGARPAPASGNVVQPLASAAPDALASRGGTVLAHCRGGVVEVVSVTPAQGFRVEGQDEDDQDKVKFESESEEIKVKLYLSCVDGKPAIRESIDD
jgi:hypothetical protein